MTASACIVVTCDGPAIAIVDDALLRARTREIDPDRLAAICVELRTASAQDQVRRC